MTIAGAHRSGGGVRTGSGSVLQEAEVLLDGAVRLARRSSFGDGGARLRAPRHGGDMNAGEGCNGGEELFPAQGASGLRQLPLTRSVFARELSTMLAEAAPMRLPWMPFFFTRLWLLGVTIGLLLMRPAQGL